MAVILTGDIDPNIVADLAISAAQPPDVLNYFRHNYEQFTQMASNLSSSFRQRVDQIVNYFNNNSIIQKAKEIIARSTNTVFNDRVYSVTWDTIHDAGYLMREYILAEPTMFNMYMNNRLDGWMDEVFVPEQTTDPKWRDDYLFAIDGIMRFENEDAIITQCSLEVDNPFNITERLIIQDAWEVGLTKIAAGIDPTNPDKDNKI